MTNLRKTETNGNCVCVFCFRLFVCLLFFFFDVIDFQGSFILVYRRVSSWVSCCLSSQRLSFACELC